MIRCYDIYRIHDNPILEGATVSFKRLIAVLIVALCLISLFSSVIAQDDGGDFIPDAPASEHISILEWSPDGKTIAVGMYIDTCNNPMNNYSIRLLNAETLETISQLGDSHTCSTTYLDWSPNSRYLVTSYAGEGADVWDTSTGKKVGQMQFSAVGSNTNKWSPDGTKIAGIDEGSPSVTIWNPFGSGDVLTEFDVGSTSSFDWSPDGERIATSYKDGIKIWDAHKGTLIQTMVGRAVSHIEWSPDGKKIASRAGLIDIFIWDVASGYISTDYDFHDQLVTQIAWSPDGQYIANASEDGKLLVNMNREDVLEIVRSQSPIYAVAWSPDGSQLAYAGQATGNVVQIIPFMPPIVPTAAPSSSTAINYLENEVYTVKWSPDGRWIAVSGGERYCDYPATDSRSIRIFDSQTGHLAKKFNINCATDNFDWSPDGQKLLSVSNFAYIWDVEKEKLIMTFPVKMQGVIVAAWSPDGDKVLFSSPNNFAYIYDIDTGLPVPGALSGIVSGWSPDGTKVVSGYRSTGDLSIKSLMDEPILELPNPADIYIRNIDWSKDGTKIVANRDDNSIRIWDALTGQVLLTWSVPTVVDVRFSPDGQKLATSSLSGKIQVWNADTGKLLDTFTNPDAVYSVTWSPDGSQLAYAGQATGDKIQMISFTPPVVATAVPSSATARPYVEDEVYSIEWSPNGRWIAVSGGERTCNYPATDSTSVRIFDAKTQQLAKRLFGMSCTSTSLDWSPDSQKLVAVNIVHDFAYIWDVEQEQLSMSFPLNMQGVGTANWNPTKDIIAVSSPTNFIAFFDPAKGQRLPDMQSVLGAIGEWSPDGTKMVSGSQESGNLYIQDIASGETPMILPSALDTGTYNMSWSQDGGKIASSNTAGSVRLWNAITGDTLLTWSVPDIIDVRFSPDGQKLATTSLNGKVQVWRVDTGKLLDTFANSYAIYSVTWSPDGSQLAYFDKDTATLHIVEPSFALKK